MTKNLCHNSINCIISGQNVELGEIGGGNPHRQNRQLCQAVEGKTASYQLDCQLPLPKLLPFLPTEISATESKSGEGYVIAFNSVRGT